MNCTGKNCIIQYDKVDPATCPCVPYCPQATPPKTNADKIRAMTDEELADFLNSIDGFCPDYGGWCHALFYLGGLRISCRDCCLKWLKEEAKYENYS